MKKHDQKGFAVVWVGVIIALLGLGLAGWQLYVACWPATTGTLLSADVVEGGGEGGPSYYPQVSFTYAVDGQTYYGSDYMRPRVDGSLSWARSAVAALEQQQSRGHLTVYYNPTRPSQSVLKKGSPMGTTGWTLFCMGCVFFFPGLGSAARSIRRRVVCHALAGGSGVGMALAAAATMVAAMTHWSLTPWIEIALGACFLVSYCLARRHPDYVHADEIAALAPAPAPRPAAAPVVPPSPPGSGASGRLTDLLRAPGLIRPEERRRAAQAGLAAGLIVLLPIMGWGLWISRQPWGLYYLGVSLAAALLASRLAYLGLCLMIATPDRTSILYGSFAERVNGVLTKSQWRFLSRTPPRLTFSHQGTNVRLDREEKGEGGEGPVYFSLTFALPQPTSFRCRVYPHGLLTPWRTFVGGQDVKLGWELFDDQFVVETNDERKTPSALTRKAQEELLRLKQWEIEQPGDGSFTGHVDLTVEEVSLQIRIRGDFQSVEDLMTFYETGGRIYDAVSEAL